MYYYIVFMIGAWFGFGIAAVLSANKEKKNNAAGENNG
jgi:hypothetical protein